MGTRYVNFTTSASFGPFVPTHTKAHPQAAGVASDAEIAKEDPVDPSALFTRGPSTTLFPAATPPAARPVPFTRAAVVAAKRDDKTTGEGAYRAVPTENEVALNVFVLTKFEANIPRRIDPVGNTKKFGSAVPRATGV